jgi:class 3 adenylate cyclase
LAHYDEVIVRQFTATNVRDGSFVSFLSASRTSGLPLISLQRTVKTTGDGALVEFASAVDAARCAIEIQRGMANRNSAIPEDRRIEFRIGINVGDIIIDEGDI